MNGGSTSITLPECKSVCSTHQLPGQRSSPNTKVCWSTHWVWAGCGVDEIVRVVDWKKEVWTPPQPVLTRPTCSTNLCLVESMVGAAPFQKRFNGSLCTWALCYPWRKFPTLWMWVSAGFDTFSSISKIQATWTLPSMWKPKSTVPCERNMLRYVVCSPTSHC